MRRNYSTIQEIHFGCVCLGVCVFCAYKLEPTYNDPSRAFKISEIFKEWFYQFHSLLSVSMVERRIEPCSLESCLPLYPLQQAGNLGIV